MSNTTSTMPGPSPPPTMVTLSQFLIYGALPHDQDCSYFLVPTRHEDLELGSWKTLQLMGNSFANDSLQFVFSFYFASTLVFGESTCVQGFLITNWSSHFFFLSFGKYLACFPTQLIGIPFLYYTLFPVASNLYFESLESYGSRYPRNCHCESDCVGRLGLDKGVGTLLKVADSARDCALFK
ncbi:hypothetical protein BC830DRAFT_214815 [Chytriomyces sp. MP71]|nr:hypothetical protein BC830DRAFT_214815 [Chytriomyces sp. MP71]